MKIAVKVIPNAPKSEYAGKRGEEYVFKIHAQPEKGKANDELIAFLAKFLGISKRSITLVSGHTSHHKVVEVEEAGAKKLMEL